MIEELPLDGSNNFLCSLFEKIKKLKIKTKASVSKEQTLSSTKSL